MNKKQGLQGKGWNTGTAHRVYNTVIQQVPIAESDPQNTTTNTRLYNILNTIIIIISLINLNFRFHPLG